jgi:hypothetical protein
MAWAFVFVIAESANHPVAPITEDAAFFRLFDFGGSYSVRLNITLPSTGFP